MRTGRCLGWPPSESRTVRARKRSVPSDLLAQACRALWLSNLSLMTAYLRTQGPAQRVMLARRIARNFHTLEREAASFAPNSRDAFARLAHRWAGLAGWL